MAFSTRVLTVLMHGGIVVHVYSITGTKSRLCELEFLLSYHIDSVRGSNT
jgi:hypothetical protein